MRNGGRATFAGWITLAIMLATLALPACIRSVGTLSADVTSVIEQSGRKLIVRNSGPTDWANVRIVVHYSRGAPHSVSRAVVRSSSTVKIALDPLRFSLLREALQIEVLSYSDAYPLQENLAKRSEFTYSVPPRTSTASPQ